MKRFIPIFFAFILIPFLAHASEITTQNDEGKVLNVQTIENEKGLDLWLAEDHSVPIVSISLSMPGGLAADPIEKPGLSYLMSILLDEGAGDYDNQEFQKELADNSISLSFSAGRDFFTIQIKSLSRNLDTAIKLANLALTDPKFDEDAIKRMKQSTEASISNQLKSPGWIAARSFNGLMFEGDAYALPGQGNLHSLKEITRDDIVDQHKKQFTTDGLQIAIAGDASPEQSKTIVSELLKGLPATSELNLKTEPAKLQHLGKTFVYDLDNPQTHITVGHEGIPVTDEDWPAVKVVNYVLGGGGFASRLMEEIREKRGLTYGVGSYPANLKRAATMQASMSVSNENAAEAIDLLKKEWKRMATTGPTENEVQAAKDYLTGSLLLNLTSTSSISSALNGLQQLGFDADYINKRNKRIKAVTAEQARIVAGRLLNADNLMIIMVGKPNITEGITPLKKIPGMNIDKDK